MSEITLPELIKNMKDKSFREEIILEEVEKWLRHNESTDAERDNFAISFAGWLKGAEGQMYEATGMSAYALLEKYKSRPFINTFNPEQQ